MHRRPAPTLPELQCGVLVHRGRRAPVVEVVRGEVGFRGLPVDPVDRAVETDAHPAEATTDSAGALTVSGSASSRRASSSSPPLEVAEEARRDRAAENLGEA